jgi:hypothetical protein
LPSAGSSEKQIDETVDSPEPSSPATSGSCSSSHWVADTHSDMLAKPGHPQRNPFPSQARQHTCLLTPAFLLASALTPQYALGNCSGNAAGSTGTITVELILPACKYSNTWNPIVPGPFDPLCK